MKTPLLFLLTLGLFSCNTKKVSRDIHDTIPKIEKVDFMKPYPELVERIDRKDSTKLGNYFKLTIATDSTCRIEWGNSIIKRLTNNDYHFHIARRFSLEWENAEFLTLKAWTGTGAWFSLILPLDSLTPESTIDNTLTKNEKKNLVVAEQFAGTDTIMYILNLKTNQTQYITDKAKCETFHHLCLDTVILSDKKLYYKWSTPHKYMDNPKTVERKLEVKI
jgi:hypothetical protein